MKPDNHSDVQHQHTENLVSTPKPTIPPNQETSEQEVTSPAKTTIIYSTLLDNTELKQPMLEDTALDAVESQSNITEPVIISYEPAPILASPIVNDDTTITPTHNAPSNDTINLDSPTHTEDVLVRTHKSERLTDSHIMQESNQRVMSATTPVDGLSHVGTAIEHMSVTLKQWSFSLNWQRTSVPKPGFLNKLKNKKQIMDLDLACLLCNRYGEVIEQVWFKNVRDQAESVRHRGDELIGSMPTPPANIETSTNNTTGSTSTDTNLEQETIAVYLPRLPPHIFHVAFVLSSYYGDAIARVPEGSCTISDDEGTIITQVSLSHLPKDCSAMWVATLTRAADSWRFNANQQPLKHHKLPDFIPEISQHLLRVAR